MEVGAGEDSIGSEVLLYNGGVMAGACGNVGEGPQVDNLDISPDSCCLITL